MTKDEALKLALEALEAYEIDSLYDIEDSVIAVIKEALAQPASVQEPDWKEEYQKAVDLHCLTLDELREANVEIKRLKAMVESQDMVLVRSAERIVDLQTHIENLEGETTPSQRTWVGLTSEETDDIIANAIDKVDALIQTADKLKDKNT